MTIYVDENGNWGGGGFDQLIFIDDGAWTDEDFEEMSKWTNRMVLDYSKTHNGKTPTKWVKKKGKKIR